VSTGERAPATSLAPRSQTASSGSCASIRGFDSHRIIPKAVPAQEMLCSCALRK
jgi:hypothetical protein